MIYEQRMIGFHGDPDKLKRLSRTPGVREIHPEIRDMLEKIGDGKQVRKILQQRIKQAERGFGGKIFHLLKRNAIPLAAGGAAAAALIAPLEKSVATLEAAHAGAGIASEVALSAVPTGASVISTLGSLFGVETVANATAAGLSFTLPAWAATAGGGIALAYAARKFLKWRASRPTKEHPLYA